MCAIVGGEAYQQLLAMLGRSVTPPPPRNGRPLLGPISIRDAGVPGMGQHGAVVFAGHVHSPVLDPVCQVPVWPLSYSLRGWMGAWGKEVPNGFPFAHQRLSLCSICQDPESGDKGLRPPQAFSSF